MEDESQVERRLGGVPVMESRVEELEKDGGPVQIENLPLAQEVKTPGVPAGGSVG